MLDTDTVRPNRRPDGMLAPARGQYAARAAMLAVFGEFGAPPPRRRPDGMLAPARGQHAGELAVRRGLAMAMAIDRADRIARHRARIDWMRAAGMLD